MRTHSMWLFAVIVLTIAAFLAVFRPLTFTPRKDPSDTSRYLQPVGVALTDPGQPPKKGTASIDLLFAKTEVYVYTPQHDLRLGLDLRGGMRVVLQIPDRAMFTYPFKTAFTDAAIAAAKQGELVEALAAPDVMGEEVKDPQKVQVTVDEQQVQIITQPGTEEVAKAQLSRINKVMAKVFSENAYDEPKPDRVFLPVDASVQNSVRNIMEKRINPTGTAEVTTYNKGNNQIVLEIPGVKDPDRVRELLHTMAQLQFRLIPQDITVDTRSDDGKVTATTKAGQPLTEEQAVNRSYLVVPGSALDPHCGVTYDDKHQPAVSFAMASPDDKAKFGRITGANVNRQLAIVLDGKIITAPVIRDRINGNGIISGGFKTMEEARDLATLLNAGALPVPVSIVENRTVSATLGADSVSMSLIAGLVGLAIVLIFMAAYYRLPGLMANLALLIYIFLSLAVLKLFDATLTLPGIAGIIISIGMAVDANVIIFERLKEELRTKKPLETAIDVAFSRAWTAILDSNVASLITGSVLYALGTGAIRGFAVTLMIGVAVSLFTAVSVTRLFMKLMIRSKAGHNLAWYGV